MGLIIRLSFGHFFGVGVRGADMSWAKLGHFQPTPNGTQLCATLYTMYKCMDVLYTSYHRPLSTKGRDQQMAIFFFLHHHLQPFIVPIRAKQVHRCSSLIGRQY